MLSAGEIYNDLGGDSLARRDPVKTTKRLVAQLKRLGHTVTLQALPLLCGRRGRVRR